MLHFESINHSKIEKYMAAMLSGDEKKLPNNQKMLIEGVKCVKVVKKKIVPVSAKKEAEEVFELETPTEDAKQEQEETGEVSEADTVKEQPEPETPTEDAKQEQEEAEEVSEADTAEKQPEPETPTEYVKQEQEETGEVSEADAADEQPETPAEDAKQEQEETEEVSEADAVKEQPEPETPTEDAKPEQEETGEVSEADTANEQPEPETPADDTPGNVIFDHFLTNDYVISEYSEPDAIPGLRALTYKIGAHYNRLAPFLQEARKAISNKQLHEKTVSISINDSDKPIYNDLLTVMRKYGLLTKHNIEKNRLTATISPVPRVQSYLGGKWLELFSTYIFEEVVGDFAKSRGLDYEILMNVKVTLIKSKGNCAHELDSVISVGDKCFAFEAKSGSNFNDYAKLYKTLKELAFVPDRYLLLQPTLEDDTALTLQYFYEFFVTNMQNFKNVTREMLEKAFA